MTSYEAAEALWATSDALPPMDERPPSVGASGRRFCRGKGQTKTTRRAAIATASPVAR